MAENAEKVFHLYPGMLPEIKKMVVEEMEPEDRCRFTRCSKLSQKTAKSSKNYIFGLKLYSDERGYVTISVSHSKHHDWEIDYQGYTLEFEEENGQKYKKCTSTIGGIGDAELWRENMDNSTDIVQYGAELFKNLLKDYQNAIRKLNLVGDAFSGRLKNYDFEIRSLNKLEKLRLEDDLDILYYLSKLKHPLKRLTVDGDQDASYLADREEIYQITDTLFVPCKFTYEQMLALRAEAIRIPFGDITEIEICNYIRSWQNGTLGKKLEYCQWKNSENKKFDIPKLFRLMELDDDFTPPPEFNINEARRRPHPREIRFVLDHNTNARLEGILLYDNFEQLHFTVRYKRNHIVRHNAVMNV